MGPKENLPKKPHGVHKKHDEKQATRQRRAANRPNDPDIGYEEGVREHETKEHRRNRDFEENQFMRKKLELGHTPTVH